MPAVAGVIAVVVYHWVGWIHLERLGALARLAAAGALHCLFGALGNRLDRQLKRQIRQGGETQTATTTSRA